MCKKLHVFSNDVVEWVVASSKQDAAAVYEETIGDPYDPEEAGEFSLEPDDKRLTIHEDETIHQSEIPQNAVLVAEDKFSKTYSATMAEWAAARGRSYLCSTEY